MNKISLIFIYKNLIKLMDLLNEFLENGDKTVLENLQKNIYEINKTNSEYWDFMINNSKINNDTVISNIDYINLKNLIQIQKLDIDLLKNEIIFNKIINENLLDDILIYQVLDIEIIQKIIDLNLNLDWEKLCKYQNLDIKTIENNIENIDWNILSENQFLTIEFIAKHKDKINWVLLGKNIKISEILNDSFIDIFSDYDLSYSFIWSNSISEEKVIQNFDKLDSKKILDLLEIRQLSNKFLNIIFEKYDDLDFYDAAAEGQYLDLEFINQHKDKLDFNLISQHQNLSYEFIRDNCDKISLQSLSFNDNINEELFLQIYEIKDQFNDDFNWASPGPWGTRGARSCCARAMSCCGSSSTASEATSSASRTTPSRWRCTRSATWAARSSRRR